MKVSPHSPHNRRTRETAPPGTDKAKGEQRSPTLCRLVGIHLCKGDSESSIRAMASAWAKRCTPPLEDWESHVAKLLAKERAKALGRSVIVDTQIPPSTSIALALPSPKLANYLINSPSPRAVTFTEYTDDSLLPTKLANYLINSAQPKGELISSFAGEEAVVTYLRCTAGKANHSDSDHTWSVNPAAIAGVLRCQRPSASFRRSVSTGQQKL